MPFISFSRNLTNVIVHVLNITYSSLKGQTRNIYWKEKKYRTVLNNYWILPFSLHTNYIIDNRKSGKEVIAQNLVSFTWQWLILSTKFFFPLNSLRCLFLASWIKKISYREMFLYNTNLQFWNRLPSNNHVLGKNAVTGREEHAEIPKRIEGYIPPFFPDPSIAFHFFTQQIFFL